MKTCLEYARATARTLGWVIVFATLIPVMALLLSKALPRSSLSPMLQEECCFRGIKHFRQGSRYYIVISCTKEEGKVPDQSKIWLVITNQGNFHVSEVIVNSTNLFSCNWGPQFYGHRDDYAFKIPIICNGDDVQVDIYGIDSIRRKIIGVNILETTP